VGCGPGRPDAVGEGCGVAAGDGDVCLAPEGGDVGEGDGAGVGAPFCSGRNCSRSGRNCSGRVDGATLGDAGVFGGGGGGGGGTCGGGAAGGAGCGGGGGGAAGCGGGGGGGGGGAAGRGGGGGGGAAGRGGGGGAAAGGAAFGGAAFGASFGLGFPSGPNSSLACATTSGPAVCACDGEVAKCIAVRAVVASSRRRSFVMMVWVLGKYSITRCGDQRISVRPDCGSLQTRTRIYFGIRKARIGPCSLRIQAILSNRGSHCPLRHIRHARIQIGLSVGQILNSRRVRRRRC
jgi:hypothetical protein